MTLVRLDYHRRLIMNNSQHRGVYGKYTEEHFVNQPPTLPYFIPFVQILNFSLSSNFDPPNFFAISRQNLRLCRLSFFKTLLILKVNHFSGFYLIEDYLKDICFKFHATLTPQMRNDTFLQA